MKTSKEMLDELDNMAMAKFIREKKYGHLTFGEVYEKLETQEIRIKEIEALVREMAPFVRGGWCESKIGYTSRVVWPDWDMAEEILNRPEVKEIIEEVDGG